MSNNRSRQFRNPRFAPEGLERRLNPSDLGVVTPLAQVATADGTGTPTDPQPAPAPIPGTDPPLLPINPPSGPVGPG